MENLQNSGMDSITQKDNQGTGLRVINVKDFGSRSIPDYEKLGGTFGDVPHICSLTCLLLMIYIMNFQSAFLIFLNKWWTGMIRMGEKMLLVAIGCSRLPGIFDIAAKNHFVVFGTMYDKVFADLAKCVPGHGVPALPVYFYETG